MVACRYEISLLMFNLISHSFATLTREISSWTLEEKFHIDTYPCIILYFNWGFSHETQNRLKGKMSLRLTMFNLLTSISYHVSSMVAPIVQWISRPTSNDKTQVQILLGTQIFLSFQRRVSKAICNLFTSSFHYLHGFPGLRKFLSVLLL